MNTIHYPEKHFRGQTDEEKVILFIRKHWIVLLKYILYLLFAALVYVVNISILITLRSTTTFTTVYPARIYLTISTILLIIFIAYIFTQLINYYLDIIIITNRRVVEVQKTIYFKNTIHAIDLVHIQDIRTEKEGFIANTLSVGNIILSSTTGSSEKRLHFIPKPHYYADMITKLKHNSEV